jgi:hypothetical protein
MNVIRRPLGALVFLLGLCLLTSVPAFAQDKIIFVQIDPTVDLDDEDMWEASNETARKDVALANAALIANPAGIQGQAFRAAGCFWPDYKLIYKDFTYVISTLCTQSMKFKNIAPYTPGEQQLPSDFRFTPQVLDFIDRTVRASFNMQYTEYFNNLQTTGERLSSTQVGGPNPNDVREAETAIANDAEYTNPSAEREATETAVGQQVDEAVANVREEDIEPITPEMEVDQDPTLNAAGNQVDQEINRPNQPNNTGRN